MNAALRFGCVSNVRYLDGGLHQKSSTRASVSPSPIFGRRPCESAKIEPIGTFLGVIGSLAGVRYSSDAVPSAMSWSLDSLLHACYIMFIVDRQ